jgi:hypothetical protein
MRASAVATQLIEKLPQLTDLFTTNVDVSSMVRSGTTVTVTCDDPHGLKPGDAVAIVGAVEQIVIGTLTRLGSVGTLITSTAYDLTNAIATTITISGAVESNFNGTFTVMNVDSRNTIRFQMTDSGATTATGSPILHNAESSLREYDATYQVQQVPTDYVFTITHPVTTLADPVGSIQARAKPRITTGLNPERAMAAYTEHATDALWLVAILGESLASKSRNVRSDVVDNLQTDDEYRQQLIQQVSLYLFVPVHGDISGAGGRDTAEDLLRPICRSMLGSQFDSGLFVGVQGRVQLVGHGSRLYNSAVYVHEYGFQQTVDLTFEDTVGPDVDVAFRNIQFDSAPDVIGRTDDSELWEIDLDLDDVPE